MAKGTDRTLKFSISEERRRSLRRHRVRAAAYRIAADCERLLDDSSPSDQGWSDALGQALLAARRITVLTAAQGDTGNESDGQVEHAQRTILSSLEGLVGLIAVTPEEEVALQDVRAMREIANHMLSDDALIGPAASRPMSIVTDAPPADTARRSRVLVADDEPGIRDVLRRALSAMGYDVVIAEDGHAALRVVEEDAVDLVLTDIEMPGMTGMELLHTLKGSPATRDIPVIVISSVNDLNSVSKCIELGAEDHIEKPYEPQILRARIVACLERKRLRDEELDHLRRVSQLTAAAEAVEEDQYVAGSLNTLAERGDPIGKLARVFDRMVSGLKVREDRLQHRLRQLRHEMGDTDNPHRAAVVSPESPFSSGEMLGTRYEILGYLGKGGMGMVYRAKDLELNEEVALKVVRRDIVKADPIVVDRLKSEMRLARKISHRNVVRVHDLGEWNGSYFITMEYVIGVSVAELIDRRGRLSIGSTIAIGTQLCEALAVAHDQQIVHRDIKPENLLVDAAGVLKVMDFGIARSIEPDARPLTAGGFIVGTPEYMAPEQLMGKTVGPRADLFAVGVVLYECLTGRPPFKAASPLALMTAIAEGSCPRIAAQVADAPPRLDALVHQQLRFEPNERSASARELAEKLGEIM